jgi:hypothetical protein
MHIEFDYKPHPRIAARKKVGPPTTVAEHEGVNGRIALALTNTVGTMWCAYVFAGLALVVLPQAIAGGLLTLVQWVSQTFIQLVMLSVIMVGQNILGRAADKRSVMTYEDSEATLDEASKIQAHLARQDATINALLDEIVALKAAVVRP